MTIRSTITCEACGKVVSVEHYDDEILTTCNICTQKKYAPQPPSQRVYDGHTPPPYTPQKEEYF